MSAVDKLVANPTDFMSRNVVYQMVPGTAIVGSTGRFTLVETQNKTGTTPDGKGCPVYEMREGDGSGSFEAYWCPYEDDKVRSVTLGQDPGLMFTAKMTGCSFGVGVPALDGSVRVAHSNSQESDALNQIGDAMYQAFDPKDPVKSASAICFLECKKNSTKEQEQWDMLHSAKGVGGTLSTEINPAMYRGLVATTFGHLGQDGKWRFYFHAFQQNGNRFALLGCFPFPNQS